MCAAAPTTRLDTFNRCASFARVITVAFWKVHGWIWHSWHKFGLRLRLNTSPFHSSPSSPVTFVSTGARVLPAVCALPRSAAALISRTTSLLILFVYIPPSQLQRPTGLYVQGGTGGTEVTKRALRGLHRHKVRYENIFTENTRNTYYCANSDSTFTPLFYWFYYLSILLFML